MRKTEKKNEYKFNTYKGKYFNCVEQITSNHRICNLYFEPNLVPPEKTKNHRPNVAVLIY